MMTIRAPFRFLLITLCAIFTACTSTPDLDVKKLPASVSADGKEYELYVYGADSSASDGFFYYSRVEVKEKGASDAMQVFDSLEWRTAVDDQGNIDGVVADYNMDGISDFGLMIEEDFSSLDPQAVWLYDQEAKQFKYTDFFEMAPTPEFDPARKQLTLTCCKGDDYTMTTYEYRNGEYTAVKQTHEVYDYVRELTESTTSELVDGVMKQVSSGKYVFGEGGERVEVKKQGSLTKSPEIIKFLEFTGNGDYFAPVIAENGNLLRYHDSCQTSGFTLRTEGTEYEGRYPVISREGSAYTVSRINYDDYGDNFVMRFRYIPDGSAFSERIDDEYEYTFTWKFDAENDRWIVYDGDEQAPVDIFMYTSEAQKLEMSPERCD